MHSGDDQRQRFGLWAGLAVLLIAFAVVSLDVGLGALPDFLQNRRWLFRNAILVIQTGLSGFVAGWLGYLVTAHVKSMFTRSGWLTLISVCLLLLAALLMTVLAPIPTARLLMFNVMALPLASLIAGLPWALLYLWLFGPLR